VRHRAATVMGVLLVLACPLENSASCVGYLDDQANCPTFQRKVHRDVTVVQLSTRVADSLMCIKYIINPVRHRVRLIKRLKIEGSMKPNCGTRCMKSGINRGVRLVNVDQLVA
jgi:hypothetical protein